MLFNDISCKVNLVRSAITADHNFTPSYTSVIYVY